MYDGMWDKVKSELLKDRFEKVIFISASDSMPFPIKQIVGIKTPKIKISQNNKKYIYFPDF